MIEDWWSEGGLFDRFHDLMVTVPAVQGLLEELANELEAQCLEMGKS